MIIIVFYALLAFFAAYILSAFFEKNYARKQILAGSAEKENLRYRKEEILGAINDLEYDFKMKKMNEADYLQLREKLTKEAVEIMKKLDETEGKTDGVAGKGSHRVRS